VQSSLASLNTTLWKPTCTTVGSCRYCTCYTYIHVWSTLFKVQFLTAELKSTHWMVQFSKTIQLRASTPIVTAHPFCICHNVIPQHTPRARAKEDAQASIGLTVSQKWARWPYIFFSFGGGGGGRLLAKDDPYLTSW